MAGERILVVEDDKFVQRVIHDILKNRNYQVDTANSGEESIEKVGKTDYDLVLLDIKLPGRDGIQTLQELMKIKPDSVVVMITGYPTLDTAKAAITLGAADYLAKPVEPDRLNAVLEKALIERQAKQASLMGKNGRQAAEKEFNWDKIAKETLNVYNEVMQ